MSGRAQFTEGAGTSQEYDRKESVTVIKLVIETTLCGCLVVGRESLTPVAGFPVLRQKRDGYRADCLEIMGLLREVRGQVIWQSLLSFALLGFTQPNRVCLTPMGDPVVCYINSDIQAYLVPCQMCHEPEPWPQWQRWT